MLKKLRTSLFFKFASLLFVAHIFLFFVSYMLLNNSLVDHQEELWRSVFLLFGSSFFFCLLLTYMLVKKVSDDIDDINDFLQEINKKNYSAVLKIQHHLEFLKLSLLLKDMVKRLKNKQK